MLDNQGFRPKSEISEKERVDFAIYRNELLALPPANSVENAIRIRAFWAKWLPVSVSYFKALKLKYVV